MIRCMPIFFIYGVQVARRYQCGKLGALLNCQLSTLPAVEESNLPTVTTTQDMTDHDLMFHEQKTGFSIY
jgi:hypothetical protein